MRFCYALAILSVVLPLYGTSATAQETPCLRQTVSANVADRAEYPVLGLRGDDFRASFHGQPVQILSAHLDSQPRRIILLLDASGSMLDRVPRTWELALTVASDLIARFPPDSSVALVVFDSRVEERIDFTKGRQAVAQKLVALRSGPQVVGKVDRRTALWDALSESIAMFGTPHPGDAMYAITDGVDNRSRHKPESVEQALLSTGVRLFAFLPPPELRRNPTPEELSGMGSLLKLVRTTGATAIQAPAYPDFDWKRYSLSQNSTLGLALSAVYRQMLEFYRLDVALPRVIDKPHGWKLELVDAHRGDKRNLHVVYQRMLVPCTAGAATH